MFWAAIVENEIVGPFRVPQGVKINFIIYCDFSREIFSWFKAQPIERRKNLIFMQDNAPHYASKFSKKFLKAQDLHGSNLRDWPPNNPDLNPIENFWTITKRRVYADGQQFNSPDALWRRIQSVYSNIRPTSSKIQNLISSVI